MHGEEGACRVLLAVGRCGWLLVFAPPSVGPRLARGARRRLKGAYLSVHIIYLDTKTKIFPTHTLISQSYTSPWKITRVWVQLLGIGTLLLLVVRMIWYVPGSHTTGGVRCGYYYSSVVIPAFLLGDLLRTKPITLFSRSILNYHLSWYTRNDLSFLGWMFS